MGWVIFIIGTIGWHAGMYGMFKRAGMEGWKALIPFYNTWCIVEKCGIKKNMVLVTIYTYCRSIYYDLDHNYFCHAFW